MAEEKPPVAFFYLCAHAFKPAGACLLIAVNANSLSEAEEHIYRCKALLLISDPQPVMCSIHVDAADSLLKKQLLEKM